MNQEIDLLQFPPVKRALGRRREEHRLIARQFGREFFDGVRDTGYGGYDYDGRWQAVARRLKKHYFLKNGDRVLDVGCAKGFLVKDLCDIDLDAYGVDISGYALKCHAPLMRLRLFLRSADNLPDTRHSLAVSINTIHNLPREACGRALQELMRVAKHQYVTVDAWRNDAERKRMEAWNLTAQTMMHVDEWRAFFTEVGYTGDHFWFFP